MRELGFEGTKDGALIKALAEGLERRVLVVWDNKLPRGHREELLHFRLTVAVVDRYGDRGGLNDEEYYRDVVHRHAHRIVVQPWGSVWKYNRHRRNAVPLA